MSYEFPLWHCSIIMHERNTGGSGTSRHTSLDKDPWPAIIQVVEQELVKDDLSGLCYRWQLLPNTNH